MEEITLKQILVDEWEYTEAQAIVTVKMIFEMQDEIRDAFNSFLKNRSFPHIPMFEGQTPFSLHQAIPQLAPPAVFLLLDWIYHEPDDAFAALKREYGFDGKSATQHPFVFMRKTK
jgi:hypothetical protein